MNRATSEYYAELGRDYETSIRQLVPKYDDMVRCLLDLVSASSPSAILDIGAGTGSFAERLLNENPAAHLTLVEASSEMARQAAQTLRPVADRATLHTGDILDFSPTDTFDVVLSNLVLHNIPSGPKARLLTSIRSWLQPNGVFLWGDMIKHADPGIQEHFVAYRMEHAKATDCSEELTAWNFDKEGTDDHPLTIDETLRMGLAAGFGATDVVWAHDTFCVFCLR